MTCKKTLRRRPGRAGILPVEVVITGRHEERRAEIEDGLGRGGHAWPASLPQRCYRGAYVSIQVAHPAPHAIAFDAVDGLAAGPLVEQVGEINPGTYRRLDRGVKTRIDLHQVGLTNAIAPELHLEVAFQADLAHQAFGLCPGILGHRDALPDHINPPY